MGSSAPHVFLSFSGARSLAVARALKDFLPDVIQAVRPFLSAHISAGARWPQEIGAALEDCHFGIACLTSDSLEARWIHYEAGALSKHLDVGRVVPYLFDVEKSQVEPPLGHFQAKLANEAETFEMAKAINDTVAEPLEVDRLKRFFDAAWPKLRDALLEIPPPHVEAPKRSLEEMLGETLQAVRGQDRRLARLETLMSGGSAQKVATAHLLSSLDPPADMDSMGGFGALNVGSTLSGLTGIGGLPPGLMTGIGSVNLKAPTLTSAFPPPRSGKTAGQRAALERMGKGDEPPKK